MAEDSGIEGKLVGRGVVDPHGYKIDTIDALFVQGGRDVPNWARVKMGILRTESALVPLKDAQEDGKDVRLVYEKEHVRRRPKSNQRVRSCPTSRPTSFTAITASNAWSD